MKMNYTKMYEALRKVLGNEQIDFAMSGRSSALIELWSRMYEEKSPWLHEIDNANIPATVAGEIARLTTLELQSKVEGSPRADFLNGIYQSVLGKLRVQTEYAFAKGSMVFKPYVSANGIAIQYIQADMFFPLDFDSEKMTRCAFLDQFRKGNAIYSRIELYSLDGDTLSIKNRVFVARTEGTLGSEIPIGSVPRWSELAEEMQFFGVSKLPIGYFAVPLGNNKDSGSPLGVSVYSRAIKQIEDADRRYSQINWEYDSKETAVHIAQSLLKYNPDTNSYEYPGGKERLYRGVEYAAGAQDKPLLDVFSPAIRDTAYYNGWNQQMRLIEFRCNLAYGTLSDPNNMDKTAEEIKASKQRSYDFISDCQRALQKALTDLVDAMAFWCDIYSLCPAGDYHLSFQWDDSIVVDAKVERDNDRADVAMGAMALYEYRMKWYGETEEEAKAAISEISSTGEVIE